ncbi:hypothetical protein DH2020_045871 [Rehmannia glutinosa]|uniref:Uncharacterized protein n=1 Tax=Rehmannia glutinosa TaxID=99300 RepID=A0ABR0UDK7_REHGL
MASSIRTLKMVLSSSSTRLKCASTRGFCQPSGSCPIQQLDTHLQDLKKSLSPSVVALESFFSGPDNREIHHSCHRGTGVFLEPTLIVTSAHVVGRVTTFYESKTVEKPDRFEHGCIRHKSYIGSTVALTVDGKTLKTKPLAVNFDHDLAVLKVVKPEGKFSPHCKLASALPRKEDILMAVANQHNIGFAIMLGNVRAIGEKTIRTKAPWPLDNELGWLEHDWCMFDGGKPPPGSTLFNCGEKVTGSITRVTGSPWFNLHCEVVGIASWEVRDEPAHFSVGFAVPPLCIRTMLDYVKAKGPEDPVVMDRWIDAHVVLGMDD